MACRHTLTSPIGRGSPWPGGLFPNFGCPPPCRTSRSRGPTGLTEGAFRLLNRTRRTDRSAGVFTAERSTRRVQKNSPLPPQERREAGPCPRRMSPVTSSRLERADGNHVSQRDGIAGVDERLQPCPQRCADVLSASLPLRSLRDEDRTGPCHLSIGLYDAHPVRRRSCLGRRSVQSQVHL